MRRAKGLFRKTRITSRKSACPALIVFPLVLPFTLSIFLEVSFSEMISMSPGWEEGKAGSPSDDVARAVPQHQHQPQVAPLSPRYEVPKNIFFYFSNQCRDSSVWGALD